MTPRSARTLRVGLLGLVAVVVVAVLGSLRARPSASPGPNPTPAGGGASTGTTSTGLVLRNFRAGDERFVIKAKSSQGQDKDGLKLQGVEVTFRYNQAQGKGKPQAGPAMSNGSATIVADECVCEPEARKAAFRGHVKVTTDDGLELETEALDYAGETGAAESDQDVRFKRGKLSGTAKGARYHAQDQRLELLAEVRIRIEEDGKPPTDIEAGHAVAQRSDDTMDFTDGVVVKKGTDTLEAAQLSLGFIGAFEVVTRALAKDDVKVQTGDATIVPAAKGNPAGKGTRRLSCRKLDITFRPDRTLQDAVAHGGRDAAGTSLYADLELLPAPGRAAERRKLQSQVIMFRFDDKGQLVGLEGHLGTILTSEPVPVKGTPPRISRSESLVAVIEAVSGALQTVDLKGGVEFEQAKQRASAREAHYDGVKETLFLTDEARVFDEEQGSDLRADAIDLGTRKETVAARGSVRHTLAAKGSGSKEGLLSREDPAVFLARFFDYDGASKTGRYRENALLRSGRDEVRAPLLVVEQPAPGQRRLTGSGGVGSTLHPRPSKGAKKPPEVVETRSEDMVYDEAKSTVTYKGDVSIRQGDIHTKSPEAVLTLTADGQTIESLVAGEPVEVEQGTRKAKGTKGTYTPRTETFVLVGQKVEVQEPNRRVEGRILTFQVGDDRIRIDGQEEARTEAVFQREPLKREPVRREPPKK